MKRQENNANSAYARVKKHRFVVQNQLSDSSSCSLEQDSDNDSHRGDYPEDESFDFEDIRERRPFSHAEDTFLSGEPVEVNDCPSPNKSLSINLTDSEPDDNESSSSGCRYSSSSYNDEYYSNDSSSFSDLSSENDDSDIEQLEEGGTDPSQSLKIRLRSWTTKNRVTFKALTELLVLLLSWISKYGGSFLQRYTGNFPRDARSLLGTTAGPKYTIRPMQAQRGTDGEFVYFGLRRALNEQIEEKYFPEPLIALCVNIDGLPLYKSSSISFWPIMCKIFDTTYRWNPFPVAIFCGPDKPNNIEDCLSEFIDEMTTLLSEGIFIKGRHYAVKCLCYICDIPARAFVKCITGHTGFYCCGRCEVKGETINRKRVYPENNATERTEESFLLQAQEEHHSGTSPLTRIPGFQPIKGFSLDYMHCICLGIMKRLLAFYWIAPNKKKTKVTLSAAHISDISYRLESIKKCVPLEFPRKPRILSELLRFKATEYRFLLLYCGRIVFRGILPNNVYKHFLLLHTAIRILCCPTQCLTHAQYAKSLLRHFFDYLPDIYGKDAQIINMHNAIHLADDCINYRLTLDMLSGFDFENELGKMKKVLRSPNKPLAQYCRRKMECAGPVDPVQRTYQQLPRILIKLKNGVIVSVYYRNVTIKPREPDNFVLLSNDQIVEVTRITKENSRLFIHGQIWHTKKDIFAYPCDSSHLGEWIFTQHSGSEESWELQNVKAKLVRFRMTAGGEETNYACTNLHSMN